MKKKYKTQQLGPIASESPYGESGSVTGSSSFMRKKQVRFTNVYDGNNLTALQNMREERLQQLEAHVDQK